MTMMDRVITYGAIIFVTLMVWLIGFSVIIGLDTYTDKKRKRLFAIVIAMVFTLIMQNYLEYYVMRYHPDDTWRTALSVYGYSIRPVILVMFAHLISPNTKLRHWVAWVLAAVNVAMHVTAFWVRLVFFIRDNSWTAGPLRHWCLVTSAVLLLYLAVLTALKYRSEDRPLRYRAREIGFHSFWMLLIVAGIVADSFVNQQWQWVDYLTISIVAALVLGYIWFHQKSVREYQVNFVAEQRMQLVLSQIQPHFIYNALTSIQNIEGNPEETKRAIAEFANYIRGNLAALDGKALIPFEQELANVKDYVSLQSLRFEDRIDATYDIRDVDFAVPPLTVQILVENAIKHGITVRYEPGTIAIRTYRDKKYHVINVVDDGVGFDTAKLKNTDRVGLRAVRNRLQYYLDATIDIESEPGKGTSVTIRIPSASPEGTAKHSKPRGKQKE